MPSNDLALQAESLPTETPFEALPPREERPALWRRRRGRWLPFYTYEETMEEIPTIPDRRGRGYAGSNGKLSGKEPTVFTGDRKDAESFILEWQIYQMLNYDAAVMRQPFTRATLFLSFIKGPAVHEWNMLQVNWLMTRARTGALPSEEFLYDTIEAAF
jgi:hypothetical protein